MNEAQPELVFYSAHVIFFFLMFKVWKFIEQKDQKKSGEAEDTVTTAVYWFQMKLATFGKNLSLLISIASLILLIYKLIQILI